MSDFYPPATEIVVGGDASESHRGGAGKALVGLLLFLILLAGVAYVLMWYGFIPRWLPTKWFMGKCNGGRCWTGGLRAKSCSDLASKINAKYPDKSPDDKLKELQECPMCAKCTTYPS